MRSAALVVASLLLGCEGEQAPPPGAAVLGLEPMARYGSLSAGESALSEVSGLALTDSAVLVLESTPPRVALFAYDGRWLRDFGRQGDGPGELQRPSFIGTFEEGVWVGDPRSARLEVFSPEGRPTASYRWSVPSDPQGAAAYPLALLADGDILAGPGRGVSGFDATHRSYYRASPGGEVRQRLYQQVLHDDLSSGSLPSGQVVIAQHPLGMSSLVSPYPDGSGIVAVERPQAATADSSTYCIRVVAVDGHLETEVPVSYTPIPAEGWLERYLVWAQENMVDPSATIDPAVIDLVETMHAERRFHPPASGLLAGADGSIWVRREELFADSVTWDVFTRGGVQVGSLATSAALDLLRASLEEVWGVTKDDLDVPYVVRFRLIGAQGYTALAGPAAADGEEQRRGLCD